MDLSEALGKKFISFLSKEYEWASDCEMNQTTASVQDTKLVEIFEDIASRMFGRDENSRYASEDPEFSPYTDTTYGSVDRFRKMRDFFNELHDGPQAYAGFTLFKTLASGLANKSSDGLKKAKTDINSEIDNFSEMISGFGTILQARAGILSRAIDYLRDDLDDQEKSRIIEITKSGNLTYKEALADTVIQKLAEVGIHDPMMKHLLMTSFNSADPEKENMEEGLEKLEKNLRTNADTMAKAAHDVKGMFKNRVNTEIDKALSKITY